jgi:hypothetical protein
MADFNDFFTALGSGIKALVMKTLKDFENEAVSDGKAFIETIKSDLNRWTRLLAQGELSQDDFAWLILGKKDLAKLLLLKEAGLSAIKIERFRNGIVDLIIKSSCDVFL